MVKMDLQRFADEGMPAEGGGDVTTEGSGSMVNPNAGTGNQNHPSFDDLIKGEYKEDYDRRVQAAIQQRFRNQTDLKAKMRAYDPIMQTLGQKYRLDPSDVEGITKRLTDDDSLYAEEANRMGLPVETVKTMKKLEAENKRLTETQQQNAEEAALQQHFAKISQQAEELKADFPGFDLMTELQNPRFARMTSPDVGISVRDAYYAIHGEEIQKQSMQYAARQAGQRIAASVRSGAARPRENGMGKQVSAPMGVDVAHMDPKARAEYRRRIMAGEDINFRDKI